MPITNNNKKLLLSVLFSFMAMVSGIIFITVILFLRLRSDDWCLSELQKAVPEVQVIYIVFFGIILISALLSIPLVLYLQWVDQQKF